MKKIYALLFVFSFFLFGGVSFGYSDNGCCSYHGGVRYISTEGTVLCRDNTISSCYGRQGSEVCEGVSNYTQSDFGYVSQIVSRDYAMENEFNKLQSTLEELYSVGSKIRSQSSGRSERLMRTSVAKAEAGVRDRYCTMRDSFIVLAQGYLLEEQQRAEENLRKAKEDLQRAEENLQRAEEEYNEIGTLLKDGDSAFKAKRWEDAIYYYSQALNMIGRDPIYTDIREQIDHAIRIANRKIALVNSELQRQQEQKELIQKQEADKLRKDAEQAKNSLGDKAKILESLVPVIKSKDTETQEKISLILETFKASKDEYTRNIGIYLSYLLE